MEMKITKEIIIHIEKALRIKLYENQKRYLLNESHLIGGRGVGKTLAYCIKLALSDGDPLNMKKPWEFSDYGDGSKRYAYDFFRREFMYIRNQLKDYGFLVREIYTGRK